MKRRLTITTILRIDACSARNQFFGGPKISLFRRLMERRLIRLNYMKTMMCLRHLSIKMNDFLYVK